MLDCFIENTIVARTLVYEINVLLELRLQWQGLKIHVRPWITQISLSICAPCSQEDTVEHRLPSVSDLFSVYAI